MKFMHVILFLFFDMGCSFYSSSISKPLLLNSEKASSKHKLALTHVISALSHMKNISFKNETQNKLISSRAIWEKEISSYNFEYLVVIGDQSGLDYMSSYRDLRKSNLIEVEVTTGCVENNSFLFFSFSLGILPNIKDDNCNYTFDVKIYDKNGKKYSRELNKMYYLSEYTSFLIFPLCLVSDYSKFDKILSDMMLNYLAD